ncbi:hypothetical protein M5689_012377 [Euphorbia peplus]|nr:hypothetical protein M5689_012377 [Euphorbia peplus]
MNSPVTSDQKDPTFHGLNPNSTTQDEENHQNEDQNPQSPKPITLEIPDSDQPNPNDPNQPDRDEVTVFSPTITSPTFLTFSRRGFAGGGGKRKKRNVLQEKRSQEKLETLSGTLNIIPFKPGKTLDLNSHEALLRRIGLWDFARLDFDFRVHRDLILQLIANFSPSVRGSKVNDARIGVNRADLARALCLPVKKEKADGVVEVKESDESVSFVVEFVQSFMLLHEDTWLMSDEVCNTMNMIKEGNFEKVDFAKLIWVMVERELSGSGSLGNCYYASHLQLLIKSQKEEILKVQQEPLRLEIDLREDEEEEEVVKTSEEHHRGSEFGEYNIELSLGGPDNAAKDDGVAETNEKEHGITELEMNEKEQFVMDTNEKEQCMMETNEKEQCIMETIEKEQSDNDDNDAMDFEESKEDEHGQWQNTSMDGLFLQRCNYDDVECEEETKPDEEEEEEEEEGKDSEYEEEKDEEEMHFSLSPNSVGLEGLSSETLIAAIEASQNPYSGMQNHDNVSSVEFLTTRADAGHSMIPGGSSPFNGNGSKRVIGHLENDMPNKRMRSDGHWDNMKPTSEFDIYMEQMEHVMGKARMSYDAKEQAYQNLNMEHQMLVGEFEHRNNLIHNLHKAKMEEQQRRQMETYRLEHELNMMSNLLEGYRKALKETTRAFAEYRKKCPLPEEPIYKDTGSGGLVLSTSELEKLRLKREEEERLCRLMMEKKIKEFEAHWTSKFEGFEGYAESMCSRLQDVEKELNLCKEGIAKRKKGAEEMLESAAEEMLESAAEEMLESAPSEEQVAQQSV